MRPTAGSAPRLRVLRLLSPKTVQLMLTALMPGIDADVSLGFGLETPDNDHQSPRSLGTFS